MRYVRREASVDEMNAPANPFWMLECYPPRGLDFTAILTYPSLLGIRSWCAGTRFETEIPEPIRLEWDPETTGMKKSLYKPVIPLFLGGIVAALRKAGVDNLDCYKTQISHPETGEVTNDYLAVNIIGVVSAADMAGSIASDPSGGGMFDVDFDSLKLDVDRTRCTKMFRLAECVTGIVIHHTVKASLESAGGFGLTFVPPSKWIG